MERSCVPAMGKDAPYGESVGRMKRILDKFGFEIEEVSWLNPVPGVWSVHIREKNFPAMYTNGKGACRESAMASALGEFFERLSCNYFFSDYYFGKEFSRADFLFYPDERWFDASGKDFPEGLLTRELTAYYNPHGELENQHLVDFNSGNARRGICALPFKRVRDGQTVLFPVNILDNLYVSNGMAAGNSKHEARVQALSEIIERYVKNRIISEGITLPDIPDTILATSPLISEAVKQIKERGFTLMIKDASLGGQFPVVNITLLNPADGGAYAAFGAHPLFRAAIERTLTELLQGRGLDSMKNFHPPSFDMDKVASPGNLEEHFIDSGGILHWDFFSSTPDYPFCHWNFRGTRLEEFDYLVSMIHGLEKEIYIRDHTHLDVYCCRIVIPGISEIYPVGDLVDENKNLSISAREAILDLHNLDDRSIEQLYDHMMEAGYPAEQPVSALIGIAADRGSVFETITVGELNAMLSLALKEFHDALMWCEWCSGSQLPDADRKQLYRCLGTLLNLKTDPQRNSEHYRPVLESVFGETRLEICEDMIEGRKRFYPFPPHIEKIQMHGRFLEAWAKSRKRMRKGKEAGKKF